MNMRSSTSTVTFTHPVVLSGYSDQLPAGAYEVVVEEELLQGLSFVAYRRTATYLTVRGRRGHAGCSETWPITERDLEMALRRDRALAEGPAGSEAALSPLEDLK